MLVLPTPAELKAQRVRLGLTQAELAAAAGVSQPLVARIERGSVDPSYSTLRALVDALNRSEHRQRALSDLMTRPVATVRPRDRLGRAVRLMRTRGFSQLPVLDRGVPVGSLSESLVVRALKDASEGRLGGTPVRDVMGAPFPAVAPETGLDEVRRLLEVHPAVLVMQRGRVRGIVTRTNLLETMR